MEAAMIWLVIVLQSATLLTVIHFGTVLRSQSAAFRDTQEPDELHEHLHRHAS